MNALTPTTEAPPPARRKGKTVAQSDANAIFAVIQRAASDPNTDVDKLDRLLALYERVKATSAKEQFAAALVQLKPKLPSIDKLGRIEIREKVNGQRVGDIQQSTAFARWEDIDEAITPILHEEGFVISFRTGQAPDGKVQVTGVLLHKAGHSEETTITLMHDSSGSKNPVQAIGSSLSYGKRYAATMLLNLRTKGEDDDGRKAGDPETDTVTDGEFEHLQTQIARTGSNVEKLCNFFKIGALKEMTRKDFPRAMEMLNAKPTVKK